MTTRVHKVSHPKLKLQIKFVALIFHTRLMQLRGMGRFFILCMSDGAAAAKELLPTRVIRSELVTDRICLQRDESRGSIRAE
jgi:hypothetical protein